MVGPFTGAAHAFAVDHLALPASDVDTTAYGDDLDGNGTLDNRLGVIYSALVQTHDATTHGDDMVASGALASPVTIRADSLTDGIAGIAYGPGDGVIGGHFTANAFASNRSATTQHPGAAVIALPIFADADPLVMTLANAELDLVPDGVGYTGTLRGGVAIDEARMAAYAGVLQMMTNNPAAHLVFARALDTDHDGTVTFDEVSNASLLAGFLNPDLHAHGELISVGFAIHLVPCSAEPCITATPADACHDRVRDGDETDVDCGGSCGHCTAAKHCALPSDCASNACDSGECRGSSCLDGVRDGFESDVDCGAACPKCTGGQTCANGSDCISGSCTGAVASTGICAS